MQPSATIVSSATEALLGTLARRGADAKAIVARVGVARDSIGGDDMMPLATFTTILEAAAAEKGSVATGLELGECFPFEGLGAMAPLVLSARTVGEGFGQFIRYFPSVQSNTSSALGVSDGVARISYSIADPTVRFRVQDANFTLAMWWALLSALLGRRWRGIAVDFEHQVDDHDAELYRAHFDCPLRFGRRENAISFPAALLDAPLPKSDPALNARMARAVGDAMSAEVARLDLVAGLEAWMTACLAHGASVDVACAASDFGMSLRSFQRKLAERSVAYVDVRNSVRLRVARCMLAETAIPITAIALHLGYSETSAFSRGFRQQVGMSPWTYRETRGRALLDA